MLRVELSALIGRLDTVARQGLEQAAVLCAQQQAPEVTAGHLLQAIVARRINWDIVPAGLGHKKGRI